MKRTIVLLTALFLGTAAMAQHELGAGLEAALPMGDFGKSNSFGIGATLKYAYNFGESSAITATAGYITYAGKEQDIMGFKVKGVAMGQIPFKVGYRHSFSGFYVEPQLGFSSFSASGGGSTSGFTYAANLGYKVSKFDLSARYESVSVTGGSLGLVGFRIGYIFMGGDK